MLALLIGVLASVEFFENTIVTFGNSYISGSLGGDPRTFAAVSLAYAAGALVMIVNHFWLARQLGYRKYLSSSLALFIGGCALSAWSSNLDQLLVARAIQGFGGAACFTGARILAVALFPPEGRLKPMLCFGLGIALATAFAPALGGELLEGSTWPALFWASIPLAALALAGVLVFLPADARPPGSAEGDRPDLWPLALYVPALGYLLHGFVNAGFDALAYPSRLSADLWAGVLLLSIFVASQWWGRRPLLPLRLLFARPSYAVGLLTYLFFYLLSSLYGFLFPVFVGQGLGFPVYWAGWLSCFSTLIAISTLLCYLPLARRFPPGKPMMAIGMLFMALTAFIFTTLDLGVDSLWLPLAARGLFLILTVLPVSSGTFAGLSDELFGPAYQTKNVFRQLVYSGSAALCAVMLQIQQLAARQALLDSLSHRSLEAREFIGLASKAFAHEGVNPHQASGAALGLLSAVTSQQTLALACREMFFVLMWVALVGAVVALGLHWLGPKPAVGHSPIQDME